MNSMVVPPCKVIVNKRYALLEEHLVVDDSLHMGHVVSGQLRHQPVFVFAGKVYFGHVWHLGARVVRIGEAWHVLAVEGLIVLCKNIILDEIWEHKASGSFSDWASF